MITQKLRKYARCVLYGFSFYSGIFFLARFILNRKGKCVTILTFHRVGDNNKGEISQSLPTIFVSNSNFEKIIKFLLKFYRVISLSDYIENYYNREEISPNTIIITFDDGYRDIYANAYPILQKYRVPATIFLTTSFISSDKVFWWDRLYALCKNSKAYPCFNHFPDLYYTKSIKKKLSTLLALDRKKRDPLINLMITELQTYEFGKLHLMIEDLTRRLDCDLRFSENKNKMLSWSEVEELKNNGFTFGSHTQSHKFLGSDLTNDKVIQEVHNSRLELEYKLKSRILAFSYPGGKISSEIRNAVSECGYKIAFTQNPGINSDSEDIFALKRINIWDGTVEGIGKRFSKSLFALQLIKNDIL